MLLFVFFCTVGAANDLPHNLVASATGNGDCFGFASAIGYIPATIWILSGADFNGDTDFFCIRGNNLFTQFAYIHSFASPSFCLVKNDFYGHILNNVPEQ